MCEHVFSGCARDSGGWESHRCCGCWHIFGLHICHHRLYHVIIIALLHLVVDDLHSLSDVFDLIYFGIYFCNYPVYAMCCLNVCICVTYNCRGRCSSSSMMV